MASNMDDLEVYLLVKTAGWYYTSVFYRNLSARVCSLHYFLLEGVLTGIWSVALSTIQSNLDMSDSKLGYAVLFSSLGTAATAPITAFLMRKYGIQRVVFCGSIAYCAFLPLLAVSNSFGLLCFAMFIYGLAWGMTDICANSSAILTEIVAGKAILGSFHGSYSLAAASGSLIGALMTSNGVSILTMFLIFFGVCGTLSVIFCAALYDKEQEVQIAIYNNKMSALQDTADSNGSPVEPQGDEEAQEAVNEILLGFDASELREGRTQEELDAQLLQDRTHITYTTDWRADPELCRYSEDPEDPNAPLLSPLLPPAPPLPVDHTKIHNPDVSPRQPRFPRPDRSRLMSDEIGSYQVRSNSFVSIVEPVNPYLLLHLCCLCFLAAFGEGGLVTWTVIYFEKVLDASSVSRSAGYVCFMVAMALGRFCCDYLRRTVGRRLVVFLGGILASGGLMVVFAVSALPHMAAVVFSSIGLTIAGLGLSTLLPISFSSAGHLTELQHSGSAVATVAASAYCGSIVASPLVGVISDASGSLHYGFLLIAVVVGLIVPGITAGLTKYFTVGTSNPYSRYKLSHVCAFHNYPMNEDDAVLLSDLCYCKFSLVSFRNRFCRAASLYFFVVEGICIGLWGMVLPTITTNLQLSDSELGAAALCTYLGTLVATPLAAYLIHRVGVRRTALISTLGFCSALPFIVAFDSYVVLLFVMLTFGIFWGITDVMAGNATVLAEIVGNESYMGTNYGIFSLTAGGISLVERVLRSHLQPSLICASLTLVILNIIFSSMVYDQPQELYILQHSRDQQRKKAVENVSDTTDSANISFTGGVSAVKCTGLSADLSVGEEETDTTEMEMQSAQTDASQSYRTSSQLTTTYSPLTVEEELSSPSKRDKSDRAKSGRVLSRSVWPLSSNTGALLVLGSVAFLATFCESCLITWIVVYYDDVLHAAPAHRAAGFGCMMVSMAFARFTCDFLRSRYTTQKIVLGAGALLVTGIWSVFGMSFVPDSVVFTSMGMVLVGLGVAPLNPLTFSAAGHLSGLRSSGSGVATVAACAYSGSIISSPLVGVIADATGSLRYGFLFVAVALTFIVPLSMLVPA